MKSTFAGKRHDLSAAERVYGSNNGLDVTDSAYRALSFYRTPDGSWFLQHTEGPATTAGTSTVDILLVSPGHVRAYLTKHGATAALERHFPSEDLSA
jgi:hypothetical protein